MTDTVKAYIQETPVIITINDNTPILTITNNETSQVSIIQASSPVVVSADSQPVVVVNTGLGGSYDKIAILEMLKSSITYTHLATLLGIDIAHIQNLWNRIGEKIVLTYDDGQNLQTVFTSYTDTQIQSVMSNINTLDGKVDIQQSTITQQAGLIDNNVMHLVQIDDTVSLHESRILQTESAIISTVSDLSEIGNDITLLTSSIAQAADRISIEVAARQLTDAGLIETNTSLQLTTDALILNVTKTDGIDDRLTSAEISLTDSEIELSVVSQNLTGAENTLSAIQTMTANQWGVVIQEDGNGHQYASGFKLILHPEWVTGFSYTAGYKVYYIEKVWNCVSNHTSSTENIPGSSAYWEEVVGGVKTDFTVIADEFNVLTPTGPQPLFTITNDVIYLNTNLVVISGALQIGEGSSGYSNLSDIPTSLADINSSEYARLDDVIVTWFYGYDPSLSNVPYTNWSTTEERDRHINDLFYNTLTKKSYRFKKEGTVYSWESIVDPDIQQALSDASTAQDTADNKKRVFITTPTVPYDIGDLWDRGSTLGIWRANTATESTYSITHWQVIADKTGSNTANDTALVAGVNAATVKNNAAAGATFTSTQAGALAYLSKITDTNVTSISGGKILTGTITANKILSNSLTANEIAANTITANEIAAGAITANEVGTNEIIANSGNIKNLIVTNAKIEGEAYLNGKKLGIAGTGSFTATYPITVTHNLGRIAIVEHYSSSWLSFTDNHTTNSFRIGSNSEFVETVTYAYM